jgi:hypothetical protein
LDHSSVTSSPRLIAGSYVLHRLLVPRHPPCALTNLTTQNKDARVHCAVLKLRTATTPTRRLPTTPTPHHGATSTTARSTDGRRFTERTVPKETRPNGPIPQDPTACQAPTHRTRPRSHPNHEPTGEGPHREHDTSCTRGRLHEPAPTNRRSTLEHPPRNTRPRQRPGRHPHRAGARCSLERR